MSASVKLTDWVEGCLESETKCPCTTCSLPCHFFSVVSWNMDKSQKTYCHNVVFGFTKL